MKTVTLLALTLCVASGAWADFSYTTTRKNSGAAAGAAPSITRHYFKGQKMLTDSGDTATLIDFDAQTVTNIQKSRRAYTVTRFSDVPEAAQKAQVDAKIDARETGQKKIINGYNASELLMTMDMDSPQMAQAGMKLQLEISIWMSSEVPGAQELKAFYTRNGAVFPWAALSGAGMQKSLTDMQKAISKVGGVPLLQVMTAQSAGGGVQSDQVQAAMTQARAQLEAIVRQGGPAAASARQALARMGGAPARGSALFEVTLESSDFSTAPIPDSVFALPAGFQGR